MALAPLLLVYDAESAPCRALVDWVQKRDSACLIVAFPYQNGELVRVAPELAGLAYVGEVHGLDTRLRSVRSGRDLVPDLFRRLPGWAWLAPLLQIPGFAGLAFAWLRH